MLEYIYDPSLNFSTDKRGVLIKIDEIEEFSFRESFIYRIRK